MTDTLHTGDHLAKLGAETALNLVSIFGGARQGKSFLMNMLSGDDRLFKISNSKDPWYVRLIKAS